MTIVGANGRHEHEWRLLKHVQVPENFRVDPKIVWAKLRALADGADLATRQLWGD